ncbi:MAG: AAA-like domain-containing protein [Chloroflexota bacterium]
MFPQSQLTQLHQKLLAHFGEEELRTLCFDLGVDYADLPAQGRQYKARELVATMAQQGRLGDLTAVCQQHRSNVIWHHQARLFIAYSRHAPADQLLAHYLRDYLTARGQTVFIDKTMRSGADWLKEIDQQIKTADFLIPLLSPTSADSEMVQSEIQRAYSYRQTQGKPQTLPVHVAYKGLLPYAIDAFLSRTHYVLWQSEADNETVAEEIWAAINGQAMEKTPVLPQMDAGEMVLSEDGRLLTNPATIQPPLPEFDPRLVAKLPAPGGAVKLRDTLYVQRHADQQLQQQLLQWGSTTTIRAPRQTGKTSLLLRGLHNVKVETKAVFFDFQTMGSQLLAQQETFLRELAETFCRELRLDEDLVEAAWNGRLGAQKKLTYFLEDHILPAVDQPLILAIDEADALLQTDYYRDFFGLLRSWHNLRARSEAWEKLNIVLVISTEPYLLIDDIHQSPFNVGTQIALSDFTTDQVNWLNQQHGSPIPASHLYSFMQLLNGHPFLTRKLLYLLAHRQSLQSDTIAADDGPFGDHLRRLYWGLRENTALVQGLREVLANGRCRDEDARWRLLRAGLIEGSGTAYRFRCGLYERYFRHKLGGRH